VVCSMASDVWVDSKVCKVVQCNAGVLCDRCGLRCGLVWHRCGHSVLCSAPSLCPMTVLLPNPVLGVAYSLIAALLSPLSFPFLPSRLMELHHKYLNTPLEAQFPRPIFRIAVLYVEEEESVRRQLARGRAAIQHNQRVVDSGIGELQEVRATDLCAPPLPHIPPALRHAAAPMSSLTPLLPFNLQCNSSSVSPSLLPLPPLPLHSEKSARRRYHIFRQHYDTLLRLKAFFPFHLIDGMGTLAECREQVHMWGEVGGRVGGRWVGRHGVHCCASGPSSASTS
ncbi:unnamed protein product, partial [Closterium sp. NIES-53]